MSHAVFEEISPPSTVDFCLHGCFAAPGAPSAILIRSYHIELWRLADKQHAHHEGCKQLRQVCKAQLFGSPLDAAPIHMTGGDGSGDADRVALLFKMGQLVVCGYSVELNDFATLSLHSFNLPELTRAMTNHPQLTPTMRIAQPHTQQPSEQHDGVEPVFCGCAALRLFGDHLIIVPFRRVADESEERGDGGGGAGTADALGGDVIQDRQDQAVEKEAEQFGHHELLSGDLFVGASWSVAIKAQLGVHQLVDFAFVDGPSQLTLALLVQTRPVWCGRLGMSRGACCLMLAAVDCDAKRVTVMSKQEDLPMDCSEVIPLVPRSMAEGDERPLSVLAGCLVVSPTVVVYSRGWGGGFVQVTHKGAWLTGELQHFCTLPVRDKSEMGVRLDGLCWSHVTPSCIIAILRDGTLFLLHLVTHPTDGVIDILWQKVDCPQPLHTHTIVPLSAKPAAGGTPGAPLSFMLSGLGAAGVGPSVVTLTEVGRYSVDSRGWHNGGGEDGGGGLLVKPVNGWFGKLKAAMADDDTSVAGMTSDQDAKGRGELEKYIALCDERESANRCELSQYDVTLVDQLDCTGSLRTLAEWPRRVDISGMETALPSERTEELRTMRYAAVMGGTLEGRPALPPLLCAIQRTVPTYSIVEFDLQDAGYLWTIHVGHQMARSGGGRGGGVKRKRGDGGGEVGGEGNVDGHITARGERSEVSKSDGLPSISMQTSLRRAADSGGGGDDDVGGSHRHAYVLVSSDARLSVGRTYALAMRPATTSAEDDRLEEVTEDIHIDSESCTVGAGALTGLLVQVTPNALHAIPMTDQGDLTTDAHSETSIDFNEGDDLSLAVKGCVNEPYVAVLFDTGRVRAYQAAAGVLREVDGLPDCMTGDVMTLSCYSEEEGAVFAAVTGREGSLSVVEMASKRVVFYVEQLYLVPPILRTCHSGDAEDRYMSASDVFRSLTDPTAAPRHMSTHDPLPQNKPPHQHSPALPSQLKVVWGADLIDIDSTPTLVVFLPSRPILIYRAHRPPPQEEQDLSEEFPETDPSFPYRFKLMMHPIVLPIMPSYQHQASTGELVPFGVYGGGKVVPFVSVGGERGAFVVPPRTEGGGGGRGQEAGPLWVVGRRGEVFVHPNADPSAVALVPFRTPAYPHAFLSLSSTSMIRLEYVEELDIPQRNDGDAPGSSDVAPSSAVEHIAKWDLAKPIPQLKVPLGSLPRPSPPPPPEDVIDHTDTEEPPLPPQPDAPSAATETHPQTVLMGSPCGPMALSDPSVGMLAVAVPLADEEPVVAYHGPKTGLEDEDSEYVPESLRGSFNERLLLLQSDDGAGAGVGLRRVTDRHEVRLYRLDGGLHAPCAWWKFGPLEKVLSLSFLRIYGETLLAVGSAQLHTDQPEGHTSGQVYLLQLPNPSDDAMDVIPPHPPPPLAAGTEGASGMEQYGFRVYLKSSYKGPVSVLTRFEPVSGKAASGSYVMHAGRTEGAGARLIVQEVGERQLLGGAIHDGMTFITCCSIIKDFVLIGDLFKGLSFFKWYNFEEKGRPASRKLVHLGRTPASTRLTAVACDMIATRNSLGMVVSDPHANIFLYQYKPQEGAPASALSDQTLDLDESGELACGSRILGWVRTTIGGASRCLLGGGANGALVVIGPLGGSHDWQSLLPLQSHLAHQLPHRMGLNPRMCREPAASERGGLGGVSGHKGGISRDAKLNILDGMLLGYFPFLSTAVQDGCLAAIDSPDRLAPLLHQYLRSHVVTPVSRAAAAAAGKAADARRSSR
ncbi:unnamed protein product [Vitrella brassicaformis CCMP3155]|uniref:FHA domain-containing protein n=2 Tax=Vitrella brassicaformis TaxID=1169539 RepID=A0A0G4EXD5_VITBC|nr:unnamed protein product [Vitrella brassicaformis CCMP3155]|eukprot:CEM02755.1 unnamed protein product [Vitrella brassicaformis CCMP3155]